MFKYNLNQTLYFIRDNKVCSAKVLRRSYYDQPSGDEVEKHITYYFGDRIGNFYESAVFSTIDDILYNLRQNIKAL